MDTEALTVAYARVKAILDGAAGDSTADYGGAGRFWNNGAQALEVAEIFGIKMVAPVPEGHACCLPPHARSDASGLILHGWERFLPWHRVYMVGWTGAPVQFVELFRPVRVIPA